MIVTNKCSISSVSRYFLSLLLVLCLSSPLHAQTENCPKVGIVLSGGGAKGAAHIGVLKYMEEIGIPVSYVAGTSMGSILGGLYALGYSAEELEALISDIDWPLYIGGKVDRRFLSQRRRKTGGVLLLNIPYGKFTRRDEMNMSAMPMGAVEGDNLLNLFNCLSVGFQDSMSFDSMPIPFACVATDLMTGKPKVLREGEFGRALRSSMAIPLFFTPVQWGDHLLADGGITNNLPVDVCREMGADIIIGLEVASELASDPDDLRSVGRQLQQYLSIMTNRSLDEHRRQCRIYINPDVSGINMMSFNAEAIAELVQRGYAAAKAREADFLQLKAELCGTPQPRTPKNRARTLKGSDTLIVDAMEFLGMSDYENHFIEKSASRLYGKPVTLRQVEDLIHVLQGLGLFHSVNFKTIPTGEERHYRMKVDVTPELPYRLGIGLRYDSEESAALLLHSSWNALKLNGWNARVDMGLKYNYWVDAHLGWLVMGWGDLGLDFFTHRASFRCRNRAQSAMDMHERKLRLALSTVHNPRLSLSFGISQDLNTRDPDVGSGTERSFATGLFFKSLSDTRNADAFATNGFLLTGEAALRQETSHLFQLDAPLIADLSLSFEGYLSPSSRLTFIPSLHARLLWGYNGDELWFNNLAGGSMQRRYLSHQLPFIGMSNTIQLGPLAYVCSLASRLRLFSKTYVSLQGAMLAHSSRSQLENIVSEGYHASCLFAVAASLGYKSFLGPLLFTVETNSYHRDLHAYINFGFVF